MEEKGSTSSAAANSNPSQLSIDNPPQDLGDGEEEYSRKNETLQECVLDDHVKRNSFPSFPEPVLSSSIAAHKELAKISTTSINSTKSKNITKDHYTLHYPPQNQKPTKANYISTTKYTLWTFIPKNLYFQFSRVYNVYFLLGALSTLGGTSSISPASMIAPLLIVLLFSAIKDGYEDYKRYMSDYAANNAEYRVIRNGEIVIVKSMMIQPGDFLYLEKGEKSPVDAFILSTSFDDGTCFVDTAELDGETNLKRRTALLEFLELTSISAVEAISGRIECELPNENLHKFNGRVISTGNDIGTKSISMDHLILRGAVLRNTEFAYCIVVYTGANTKIIENLKPAKAKISTLERQLNYFVGAAFVYNVFLLVSSVWIEYNLYASLLTLQGERKATNPNDYAIMWYIGPVEESSSVHLKNSFLSYFALYSYVIPISLFVTMEIVRLIQGAFMVWDVKMESNLKSEVDDSIKNVSARANNTNLNEDLAKISYIFSDKTGTFTKNEMKLAKWFVDDVVYDELESPGSLGKAAVDENATPLRRDKLIRLLRGVAVCHDVIPSIEQKSGKMVYESQSPDETALVMAAKSNAATLKSRNKSSIDIEFFGKNEKFQIAQILTFNSTRKRMSVIVKENGSYILYCKGADNVIEERLSKDPNLNNPDVLKMAAKKLEDFSEVGLRVLMLAWRKVSEEEFKNFKNILNEAEESLEDREEKVMNAYEIIEKDMIFTGCTAIEDKLQEELPETIKYLLMAEIKVWLLTGDKTGTAINIGMSSELINSNMHLLVMEGSSIDQCRQNMDSIKNEIKNCPQETIFALVVSGVVLNYVFSSDLKDVFLEIGVKCHSVICSRVSPLQKALIVKLVRDNLKVVTLAIGDGANDVSMIQSAHIGVGIMGREGAQAVRASDYAFGEFRHLRRLLSVHGRYNYLRMTGLIYYSFYKNFVFITIQWWFGFVSAWTGQTAYEEIFFTAYNIIFTSLPPLFYAIFERDVSPEKIKAYPQLYNEVRNGLYWNWQKHITMIFSSIWHSLLIFGAVYFTNMEGTTDVNGLNTGYWVQSYFFSTPLLLTVLIKSALGTIHWVWITAFAIFLSWAFNLAIMFFIDVLTPAILYSDEGTALISHVLPTYYILCILLPLLAAVPDIISTYLYHHNRPSDATIIMEEELLIAQKKRAADDEIMELQERGGQPDVV